jgi:hypothetical protein
MPRTKRYTNRVNILKYVKDGNGWQFAAIELDTLRAGLISAQGKGAGERGKLECTPKVRHGIKGPATLNGGERCWCPDNSIPAN